MTAESDFQRAVREGIEGGGAVAVADDPILQFFTYTHLSADLQAVSEPFCKLAAAMVMNLPRNPERTVALRFLLQAKDAAVRARLYKP